MTDPVVHVIDDDDAMRESLAFLLEASGLAVQAYPTAAEFLAQLNQLAPGCIVTDVRMPGMSGLDLVRRLTELDVHTPVIIITGHGDVPLAVEAMKAGVSDFLEKPFDNEALLAAIRAALQRQPASEAPGERQRLREILEGLSPREQQVLDGVIEGKLNKTIAYELGISHRTVEVYRANMMSKTGARGLSDLIRKVMLVRS